MKRIYDWKKLDILTGLWFADHSCLSFTLKACTDKVEKDIPKFRYYKGDYANLNREIHETDWKRSLNKLSAEEAWSKFYDKMCKAIDMFISKTQLKIDKKKKFWTNKAAMILRKKKYDTQGVK